MIEKDYSDLLGFRLLYNEGFLKELKTKKRDLVHSDRLNGFYNDGIIKMFREISKNRPIDKIRIEPQAYRTLLNSELVNINTKNINKVCKNHSGKKGLIYFNRILTNLHFLYSIHTDGIRLYCFDKEWNKHVTKNWNSKNIGFIDIKSGSSKKQILDGVFTFTALDRFRFNGGISGGMNNKTKYRKSLGKIISFLTTYKYSCLGGEFSLLTNNTKDILDEFIIDFYRDLYFEKAKYLVKNTKKLLFCLSSLIYVLQEDEEIIKHFISTPFTDKDTYVRCNSKFYKMTLKQRMENGVTLIEKNSEEDLCWLYFKNDEKILK